MTTSEVARTLRARRVGKGKYMAKCPSHRERTGSLSITDMGAGNTRIHCFGGCVQADVLKAAGMTWKDLRPGGVVAPAIRERMTLEDWREQLERQLGLVAVLGAIDGKRAYWAAAEKRIRGELNQLRAKLEPEKVMQEYREQRFHKRVKKYGIEQLWKEEVYGIHSAGNSTGEAEGEVRPNGFHQRAPELQASGVQARNAKGDSHWEHMAGSD